MAGEDRRLPSGNKINLISDARGAAYREIRNEDSEPEVLGYGKKGSGWLKNPKKAAYNKVYKKTTFGLRDIFK